MKRYIKNKFFLAIISALILCLCCSCGSESKKQTVRNAGSESSAETKNDSDINGKNDASESESYPGNPDIDFIEYNHKLYEEIWRDRASLGDEWYEKCEIEADILRKCTTKELLQLVVSCPFNQEFLMYSSYDIAWNEMSKKGASYFCEFIERSDALETLIDYYGSMDIPETKLYDDSVFEGMTEEETMEYINETLVNDDTALVNIHYDEEVVISVKMMEYLIQRLKSEQGINGELEEKLESARNHMYEQESKSEYFGYGESLTEMVAGLG